MSLQEEGRGACRCTGLSTRLTPYLLYAKRGGCVVFVRSTCTRAPPPGWTCSISANDCSVEDWNAGPLITNDATSDGSLVAGRSGQSWSECQQVAGKHCLLATRMSVLYAPQARHDGIWPSKSQSNHRHQHNNVQPQVLDWPWPSSHPVQLSLSARPRGHDGLPEGAWCFHTTARLCLRLHCLAYVLPGPFNQFSLSRSSVRLALVI